jgi:hypothetical protein
MRFTYRRERRARDAALQRLDEAKEQRHAAVARGKAEFRDKLTSPGALVWSFNVGLMSGTARAPAADEEARGWVALALQGLSLVRLVRALTPGDAVSGGETPDPGEAWHE